nr:hypothetical protein [Lachnospiraceae bacterium]
MKRKTVIAALLIITMMIAGCEGTVNTAGISETAGQEAEGMEETSGTDKEETVEEGEVKDAKEYKDPTEDELKEKLEAEIVGDILVFSYDDYDKDGIHEAFAITGEIAESDFIADDIMKGNVYYIDSDEVTNASELTEKEVDPLEFFILDDTEDYVIDIGPDEANDPGSP